jgi:predicted permease
MVNPGGIWRVEVPGTEVREQLNQASLRFVTPGLFDALGVPLKSGRDISEHDTREAPWVAVVSESFVRQYWPGQNPLGRRFQFAFADRIVVGVAGDIRVRGLERTSEPQVYLSYQQVPDFAIPFYPPKDLLVRASTSPGAVVAALRRIIAGVDPNQPISDVRLMEEIVEAETAPRSVQVRVLGAFAAIAFLLAAIGIHGMLAFAVSTRSQEIGMRMALGAQRGDILRMIAGSGARLAFGGVLIGAALAYAAGRAMQSLLAGIGAADPAVFASAIALCGIMTLAGSLLPAIRAIRVDPATAIRTE